ncbi:hypothetical protein KY285_005650 [Solanum tuberosum]|nr:hypothetical protein KY285_005650 [Solanum tuberosum]
MILADIYRALTICKNGGDYFEGCNMLLQLWMIEHIRHHPYVVDFKVEWNDYIGGHGERIKDHSFSKGIEAWKKYLNKLTADKIVWNYHWFPSAEFLPPNEDMREFMYEFHPEISLRKSEIFKIWGGYMLSSPRDRVEDRTKGEVDQAYLEMVHDQPPPKVLPQGSVKGPVDREAEIEVRIKQARLEVERSYRSTLDVLSNDLKNAKGSWPNVMRYLKIAERDALHLQIEELQEQRENLTHEVNTTRHWLHNCYDIMNEARDRVLQLRDALNDVYAGYLHQNDERLGRQARVLAPHLPKALARIYKGLGDD